MSRRRGGGGEGRVPGVSWLILRASRSERGVVDNVLFRFFFSFVFLSLR